MKKFSAFLNEAQRSFAAQAAEKLNLSHVGYGKYADASGKVTHFSKDGKLVPITQKQGGTGTQNGGEETEGGEGQIDKGSISITFGRFNPPTTGHEALIKKVAQSAKQSGGEYRIYPSRTQDPKKNPLDAGSKIKFMKQAYPDHKANIIDNEEMRTIFDVLTTIDSEGYSNVEIVVGGDRVSEFNSLATKYNGDLYKFDDIKITSAGNRDPDGEGVEGISASKMRKAATDGDSEAFKKGLPKSIDDGDAQALFDAVRTGMQIKKVGKKEAKELWQIAPRLDQKTLREKYVTKKIFRINDIVENLNTGMVGEIIRRGTNYLICVTKENVMFKSWIKDLSEETKVIPASKTGVYGVPANKREVGTPSHRKYAQSMVAGQEEIKNFNIKEFINKYRKK